MPSEGIFESLVVYDNGPGIPAAAREEVFLPGKRLPGAHPDGSGMGLSIVRRIVEYYGGRVFVDPNVRVGTAIVFLATCDYEGCKARSTDFNPLARPLGIAGNPLAGTLLLLGPWIEATGLGG